MASVIYRAVRAPHVSMRSLDESSQYTCSTDGMLLVVVSYVCDVLFALALGVCVSQCVTDHTLSILYSTKGKVSSKVRSRCFLYSLSEFL